MAEEGANEPTEGYVKVVRTCETNILCVRVCVRACVFGEDGFSKAVIFILCFSKTNIFPSLSEALLFGGLFCSHLGSMSRFFSGRIIFVDVFKY